MVADSGWWDSSLQRERRSECNDNKKNPPEFKGKEKEMQEWIKSIVTELVKKKSEEKERRKRGVFT